MDLEVFNYINGLAGQSEAADRYVRHISLNYLYKGAIPVLFFWYFWFSNAPGHIERRVRLLGVLGTAFITIVVGRAMALLLPFSDRPVHDPDVQINTPLGDFRPIDADWSSFPSDHAALFFALATAFWFISRRASLLLFLHAAVIISLPRIYLGLHWPSDILGGAVVGIITAIVAMPLLVRGIGHLSGGRLANVKPLAMPVLILITAEMATMFNATRDALGTLLDMTTGL